MLDEQELSQIRDYVIRILPELLREEPEIATTIEGILAQHFPRRDEFARLLDEVQLLREQTERRFEQVEQRLDLQREEIALLREEMERRFEQVERRLDLKREEIVLLREEMDRRFALQHQEILEVRRDIARLQHGQEMILKRMDGQEAWLRWVIGDLRAEKGTHSGRPLRRSVALRVEESGHSAEEPAPAPETGGPGGTRLPAGACNGSGSDRRGWQAHRFRGQGHRRSGGCGPPGHESGIDGPPESGQGGAGCFHHPGGTGGCAPALC